MFQPLNAKVEKPNYDFSLDTLSDFYPGKLKTDIDAKYGKPEKIDDWGTREVFKYYVSQIRYKFPVIVQVHDGKVLDFFAKLPSYFLHDLFFQGLINRHGKQDEYKKFGEEAVYIWKKGNQKFVYSAACTITCFPIFFSVYQTDVTTMVPILENMKDTATQKK